MIKRRSTSSKPLTSASYSEPVGVVGLGNSARALACHLSSQGYAVHLLVRRLERHGWLRDSLTLKATGKIEGSFRVVSVTDRADVFASRVETVFVATTATAYGEVAERLAPHLAPLHAVVLFSSKLCGSVLFERALRGHGVRGVPVLETDALFACRVQPDESVWVRGCKAWTLFSASRRSLTERHGGRLLKFFPGLEPASTLIQRGLTDFGALAHPTTMIANMNAVDRREPFLFYYQGFTEKTVALLEGVEREFRAVAAAYGGDIIPMKNLLDRYYACDATSLLTAMRSVPNYRDSWAPTTLDHRYVLEDVQCTLVPLAALARKAGVPVPLVDAVVHIACALTGEDLVRHGRTLKVLGWVDKTHHEILSWIQA